jgi:predicted GIY-YIG superfamily endonuclease
MIEEAIQREKTLKNWTRAWKLRLISDATQDRDDLMERYNG